MIDGKLTQKDIKEHCFTHKCEPDDCEYFDDYCHIREDMYLPCEWCDREINCKGCKYYK